MKPVITIASICAMQALCLSCSKEAAFNPPESSHEIAVMAEVAENDEVKTYIDNNTIYWGEGEYLQLFYNDGTDKFVRSLSSSSAAYAGKTSATFNFKISASAAQSYTFGGVYPASAAVAEDNLTASAYKVNLPSMQHAVAGKYDPAAFIMVAKPQTKSSVPTSLTASYRRAVALNKLVLTNVNGQIENVEIKAPGKSLSGKRVINLTTGDSGSMIQGCETVDVSYENALPSGTADIWFTSWNCVIGAGEKLVITVSTTTGRYSKTITALSGGISFLESKLNILNVSFAGVSASAPTLKDFAREFVSVLKVWKENNTSGLKVGNVTVNGYYVPSNTTVSVNGTSYNKADMYDAALNGFVNLYNGGSLSDAIPSVKHKGWGADPYNELTPNGGTFTPQTVGLSFLRNYASRQLSWIASNTLWSNFCSYKGPGTADVDKGTPKIGEKLGCCCLERNFLMLAHFYEFLLNNGISSDIANNCADMQIDAGLYDNNIIPDDPDPVIEPSGHNALFLNGGDMLNVSLSSLKKKGINVILLGFASIEKHGESSVKSFIQKAHNNGIDVHIWMQCFYKGGAWTLPVLPDCSAYNESLFNDLVDEASYYVNLGARGIVFDYIRFDGGTHKAMNYSAQVSGKGGITELCKRLNTALKKINPEVVLSACIMADSEDLDYNTKYYGQDVYKMNKYLDVLMPMIYRHGQNLSTEKCQKFANAYSNVASQVANCECWGAIETYNGNSGLSASEILSDAQDLVAIQHDKFTGIALFRYGLGTLPDFTNLWK